MAEYEALLSGLRIAFELGIKCLDVRGDSQLVIDQVMKEFSCHDPKMEAYCNECATSKIGSTAWNSAMSRASTTKMQTN